MNFSDIFGKHKKNGIDINKLLQAHVSYELTDNFSIKRSHEWIDRFEVCGIIYPESFSERSLYLVIETIGANRDEIISDAELSYFAELF